VSARRRLLLTTAGAAALLLGVLTMSDALGVAGAPRDSAAVVWVDRPAPPLSGRTLSGQQADLRDLSGSVVLVTVWASWCPPCRQELPVLRSTGQRLGPHGLALLGVLTRDVPSSGRQLLADVGMTSFRTIQDPDGSKAVTWGATGVPETFLIDRRGRLRARCLGAVTPQWVHRYVDPVVAA